MDKLRNLESDMLLTIGGVSMGDLDVVRDVLEAEGEMVFWKVRMRPGKPLAFGRLRGRGGKGREILHFALPGNPVSCMVSFEVFVRPALLKMMGKNDLAKPMVEAEMEESVKNSGARRIYDRVIVARRNGHYYARLTGSQGSGVLTSMSRANGLAIIPEDRKMVNKGEAVQVMMLDWPEEAGG
jgi:molybdopterin molybdotransferase